MQQRLRRWRLFSFVAICTRIGFHPTSTGCPSLSGTGISLMHPGKIILLGSRVRVHTVSLFRLEFTQIASSERCGPGRPGGLKIAPRGARAFRLFGISLLFLPLSRCIIKFQRRYRRLTRASRQLSSSYFSHSSRLAVCLSYTLLLLSASNLSSVHSLVRTFDRTSRRQCLSFLVNSFARHIDSRKLYPSVYPSVTDSGDLDGIGLRRYFLRYPRSVLRWESPPFVKEAS